MYPFFRLALNIRSGGNQAPMGMTETYVSTHRLMPWDMDMWAELNNGLTLTVFDLGRLGLAAREGLIKTLKAKSWGLAIAGCSVRYRRRLTMLQKVEMRSRVICWDDRFIYIEQSMWKPNGDCACHVLYRSAVTSRDGIVAPHRVVDALGSDVVSPEPPDWVTAWIDAEARRPWPPMQS